MMTRTVDDAGDRSIEEHDARNPEGSEDVRRVTVALVEDHHLVREGLRMVLAQRPDIEVVGTLGEHHAQ
jgi:hypothetical protein